MCVSMDGKAMDVSSTAIMSLIQGCVWVWLTALRIQVLPV